MSTGSLGSRVRMVDVARRAGVGTITVSRALRTPERVSPEVRERVLAAVEATGYVPNLAAGTLKSQRSRVVAAIVPTLRNTIFAETVEGLADGLREHGLQLLIASSGYSIESEASILLNLLGQQPVAVVLTGTRHLPRVRTMLRARGLPVVETWDLADDPIDRAVGFSNVEAAYRMTHALAAHGYRRIAFAGTPPELEHRAAQRLDGYRRAMAELGRSAQVALLDELGVSFASGERMVERLLARARPPDAVFFVNDVAAFGAVQACQRRGIAVPDRLAIAGFGDFELARASNPPLTTVRIPGERIGRTAARLIVERLASADATVPRAERSVDLGFEIVRRESA
jgi:LacI family gluconate utilization system Gnt-I transcriptional repressor